MINKVISIGTQRTSHLEWLVHATQELCDWEEVYYIMIGALKNDICEDLRYWETMLEKERRRRGVTAEDRELIGHILADVNNLLTHLESIEPPKAYTQQLVIVFEGV